MIVFDTSTLIGAALKHDSIPEQALLKARAVDRLAISDAVEAELRAVLRRRKFDRYVSREDREAFIGFVVAAAARFDPIDRVFDCRDPRDNMYLELAQTAQAGFIASSDMDLLDINPWRDIRIMRPSGYLELA